MPQKPTTEQEEREALQRDLDQATAKNRALKQQIAALKTQLADLKWRITTSPEAQKHEAPVLMKDDGDPETAMLNKISFLMSENERLEKEHDELQVQLGRASGEPSVEGASLAARASAFSPEVPWPQANRAAAPAGKNAQCQPS